MKYELYKYAGCRWAIKSIASGKLVTNLKSGALLLYYTKKEAQEICDKLNQGERYDI